MFHGHVYDKVIDLTKRLAEREKEIHELKLNLATHSPCAESFNRLMAKYWGLREALEKLASPIHACGGTDDTCSCRDIAKAALERRDEGEDGK